jgi:hypothetical protein
MRAQDGKTLCSTWVEPLCVPIAIYAYVLGYSRRQLERWKEDIRTRDQRSACHGNAMKPHEADHVAIACAVLKK